MEPVAELEMQQETLEETALPEPVVEVSKEEPLKEKPQEEEEASLEVQPVKEKETLPEIPSELPPVKKATESTLAEKAPEVLAPPKEKPAEASDKV